MRWSIILGLLCTYGFLKEFRPSEPFLYQYQNEDLNISDRILNGDVYPYWTYSYLIALVPVFLLTDVLLYKPVLMLESVSYVAVWATLIWGRSVWTQQVGQAIYGWATATEIAYYAYIYVKVDKEQYQKATSFVRAAVQGGECLAYVIGQSIISFKWGTYKTLNYISFGCVSSIFLFAILLPNVSWRKVVSSDSCLSSKNNDAVGCRDRPPDNSSPQTYLQFATYRLKMIWRDFKAIYSNGFVIKWSLWWALATCGVFQVGNYIQTLWGTVQSDSDNSDVYNGITEAVNTALGEIFFCTFVQFVMFAANFLGTVTILLMQLVHINWAKWGELALTILSLVDCALLILLSQAQNVWVMYAAYVTYCVLYQMMITIAQFCLADKLVTHSYGLVFGFNTFIALGLQTALTFAVNDERGFDVPIRPQVIYCFFSSPVCINEILQFEIYGAYHGLIALIFFATAIFTLRNYKSQRGNSITPIKIVNVIEP